MLKATAKVLSGRIPFEGKPISSIIVAILINDKRPPMEPQEAANGVSYAGAWVTASICWAKSPASRPAIAEVVQQLISNAAIIPKPRHPVLEGHTSTVSCLTFSRDNSQLASASWDYSIRLWDVEAVPSIGDSLQGHMAWVNCIAFSPSGDILASGSSDTSLRLWDARLGGGLSVLNGHTCGVFGVVFSPDGEVIASASGDHAVRLWNPYSGECLAILQGHTGTVWSLDISPDGKMLVSGSGDCTLLVWDISTQSPKGPSLTGHSGGVRSIAFLPNGATFASGSWDKTVKFWDAETGQMETSFPVAYEQLNLMLMTLSPDGRYLAAPEDNVVKVWDLSTPPPWKAVDLKGHSKSVTSIAFSVNGSWVASGSWDGTVRLWDLKELLPPTENHQRIQ